MDGSTPDVISIQLKKGVVEYCVLALLSRRRRYGLELARALTGIGPMMSGEGTVYPLLARLRRAGFVRTTWEESVEGPPRRYYEVTVEGEVALGEFRRSWEGFSAAVNTLISGEK
jgi:PadR family transcriptional regulator PadR